MARKKNDETEGRGGISDHRVSRQSGHGINGARFHGGQPHEAYATPYRLRKACNDYFDFCDLNGKPYTIPGLALHLGLRTGNVMGYKYGMQYPEYQRVIDYALQKIESSTCETLYSRNGSTRGIEFLMQNTQGYVQKTENKTSLEVSEADKIKALPDAEVKGRLAKILPLISGAVGNKGVKQNEG